MADGVNPGRDEPDEATDAGTEATVDTGTESQVDEGEGEDVPEDVSGVDPEVHDDGRDRDQQAAVRRGTPLLALSVALLVAAGAFAGWGGWSWLQAATDESIEQAMVRDEVLESGREHVVALTTMDHRNVDEGLERWMAASTGRLHEELERTAAEEKDALRAAGTVTHGQVLEAGITELDVDAGTATMLASVEISMSRQDVEPASRSTRLTAELERAGDGWKLSAMDELAAATG